MDLRQVVTSHEDSGKVQTSYSLIPSLGTHVFQHNLTKRWIKVDRVREQHQQDIIGGAPWETVTLTSLGIFIQRSKMNIKS